MLSRFSPWRFPLVAKELIETAAAPRTYLLRVAYAVLLALGFIASGFGELSRLAGGGVEALGAGKPLFALLVYWLFASIYLFLPALTASEITREEESGNLDLLRVSGISARELLVGKLVSRVIAMLALVAIGLPFAGFAYSLGGVSLREIGAAVIGLFACTLQVAAWSLWCSASATSSTRALMRAYLMMGPVLGVLVSMACVPLYLVTMGQVSSQPVTLFAFAVQNQTHPLAVALQCLPILASAWLFLVLAIRALRRRHLLRSPEQRRLETVFRRARLYDTYVKALSRAEDQKILLPAVVRNRLRSAAAEHEAYADIRNLPVERPLAWRERRRVPRLTSLPLIGGYVIIGSLVIIGGLAATADDPGPGVAMLGYTMLLVAGLGQVVVAMQSAAVVSGERGRHSLDVLLTLPLTTRELVRDKLSGGARWLLLAMAFFALPTLAVAMAALGALFSGEPVGLLVRSPRSLIAGGAILALTAALLTQWIGLHVALWLGLAVSLRARNHQRAVLITLTVFILCCLLPPILVSLGGDVANVDRTSLPWSALNLLSPAWLPWRATNGRHDSDWLLLTALHLVWWSMIWVGLRWWCLATAERLLRR